MTLAAFGRWLAVALALLAIAVTGLAFTPVDTTDLASRPQPARSYAEAVDRIEAHQAEARRADLHPLCQPRALLHGRSTPRSVILWHGYTNCPQQFEAFGQQLHLDGANVFIPLLPFHGRRDRLSEDQAQLTAADLTGLADASVDIGRGLGERVTVVGLSAGGTMAAWTAQFRPDVARAVILAPTLRPAGWDARLTGPTTNLALRLPNRFLWWDEVAQAQIQGPAYAYPWYTTRGVAAMLLIGSTVAAAADRQPMLTAHSVIVTNAADYAVDNAPIGEVARRWQARGGRVSYYEFPAELGLPHDLIDREQATQRVDLTYPAILGLVNGSD